MENSHSRLYSMFIGPKGENTDLLGSLLMYGLGQYKNWRRGYAPDDPSLYPDGGLFLNDEKELRQAFDELMKRLEKNLPYFHPRYAAQMIKDPTIPAILGYFIAMLTNPNNHAYEGGPATTELELEVIDDLIDLVGFESGWGHLTSGGSLANLEALWAVRDLRIKGKVFFSVASHLSWKKICAILNIADFVEIQVDCRYRLDLNRLESELKQGTTMMVMANFGTTGCAAVDPIEELLTLREKYGFHLHVDAAYGGYAKALLKGEDGLILPREQVSSAVSDFVYRQSLALAFADSVTLDPHKHGLMPYGAGSILFRHEDLRQVILHSAPYTYHMAEKPNIGTYSLEGSRPGAAAAGCWLTHRLFPLHRSGIGLVLENTLRTAADLYDCINTIPSLRPLTPPDLDILCFYHSAEGKADGPPRLSYMNSRTEEIYKRLSVENPEAEFFFSKLIIDPQTAAVFLPQTEIDDKHFLAMRAVFIKHWLLLTKDYSYLDELVNVLKDF
jgi:glutamate/tyrosine decarboxylase-like PLP-dependent enzyme